MRGMAASKLWDAVDNKTRETGEKLVSLGLSKTEAMVYLTLLRSGPSIISKLGNGLLLPRSETYHLVHELGNKGLVNMGLGQPAICNAIDPQKAINTLIALRKLEISEFENMMGQLINELKEMQGVQKKPVTTESYMLQIDGRNRIKLKVHALLRDAKEPVYIIADDQQIKSIYHLGASESIKKFVSEGGECKFLVNSLDAKLFKHLADGYEDARLIKQQLDGWVVLEKGVQVVMSTATRYSLISEGADMALHTNATNILSNQLQLFNLLWEKADQITVANQKVKLTSKKTTR